MSRSFHRLSRPALTAAALALALAACGERSAPADEAAPAGADAANPAPSAAPATSTTDAAIDSAADAKAGPAAAGFQIESVPVSDAPLGEFPYFSLPAGYRDPNAPIDVVDFDRVPFWTGDRLHWVEGKVAHSSIHAEDGKAFSPLELQKNIDRLVSSVGGVKVTESPIPQAVLDGLPDSYTLRYTEGTGDIWNQPAQTWLVRRADRNIWVHLCADSAGAGWIIAESEPFELTATLIEADELKQQLDADGKVALQVNFATDKAEILPESMPQIEQVVALLKDDPTLKLSVNGHTDDTGDAAHNLQLSKARAAAVVAALTAQDIAPERLDAEGFGQNQPIADNSTEDGRARNRRVELVRVE